MKHNLKIILLLVTIFLFAQLIGIGILTQYIDIDTTAKTGQTTLNNDMYGLTGITPPPVENESLSFIWVSVIVVLGTLIVLLIIKFRKKNIWKLWFSLGVMLTLIMAFVPFVTKFINSFLPRIAAYSIWIVLFAALVLTYVKVFRKNLLVHNFTELFIYGGLASIIAPVLNLVSATILLLIISAYDIYAVWFSKHMIGMAEFQTEDKVFAGLLVQYKREDKEVKKDYKLSNEKEKEYKTMQSPQKTDTSRIRKPDNPKYRYDNQPKDIKTTNEYENTPQNAILGGGDIAFPLFFTGAVMKATGSAFLPIIITTTTTIALFMLYYFGKKDRYYPAMPFLSAGCFVGAGIVWLITLF
jgi:presenilin-like A22 family membrane protease